MLFAKTNNNKNKTIDTQRFITSLLTPLKILKFLISER